MLTTDQILSVVNGLGRAGTKGRTQALRRANTQGPSRSTLTSAQNDFLAAADEVPLQDLVQYQHPRAAGALPARSRTDPLSPSELAWLQRLPTDPAQIPFDDAQRLLALAASVTKPDDLRLVRSIAAPVQEFHDRKQAEAAIANASQPPIAAPGETLGALADAIAAEYDQLQPEEAISRAGEVLRSNGEQRLRDHNAALHAAWQQLDAVNAAAQDRQTVTR
jgi:hypothetical protein